MRKITYISLLLLLSVSMFADNNTVNQTFSQANALYSQNKFKEAAKLYEQTISEGFISPELFYNTANTYYRLNKIGKAIYYYEKAKMLSPNDVDVNYNLELTKLRVKNLPPEVPKIFPVRIFQQITFMKSSGFWGLWSLILFIVFLGLMYLYFIAKNSKGKKLRLLFASFIFFFSLISFIFMQYQMYQINAHNTGVVISKEIIAKSSPDDGAANLFKVYEGYKVKIENKNGNWCEITLTDGRKAWIKQKYLMIL
ncbi:MAG: tetratricopeptide repeat protein [Chlorobi bacterium]|nr:tetratricopeptide repeat protein [Chlorobiota bacterium]